MRFRSLVRWRSDPSLDGLKFFAQRMDELLFDYTLDSYKASALNSPFLVNETLSLISDIEAGILDFANLSHVLEELVWSVQNDRVAKSLLDAEIEYYTAIGSEGELPSLRLRLEVLGRAINPIRYRKAVVAELVSKIALGEKKSIDMLARTYATTLINSGVSKQHIYNQVLETFFLGGDQINSISHVDAFFEFMTPEMHKFDVLLLVSKNIEQVAESIKAFRLSLDVELADAVNAIAVAHSFQPNENEIYVQCGEVKARDAYSARQRAILELDGLGDLLSLFQHRSRIAWRQEAIVTQKCCGRSTLWITPPKGAMDKATDLRPEKAARELNTLIRSFSAKGASFRKFNRAADIHGVCINHNIIDNQLVNLWTALETLTPSNSGGSKIANVTNAVLPFLLHMYFGRLVEQFTYDLLNWDKWRARKILNKVKCDHKTPLIGKSLRLLCLAENKNLREQLFENLKDFHLLRFRAFNLSETLSDRKKMKALLGQHEKKVTWQIRRIYRTRNLIVHSGGLPPPYIDTLVENGHDYLDAVMFEIMRISCGDYRATTLEQVFEIAKIKYADFSRKLSAAEALSSEGCGFLLGNNFKRLQHEL